MQTATPTRPAGLRAPATWQLSLRRSLALPTAEAWRLAVSEWLPDWLEIDSVPLLVGAPLRHDGAVRGRVVGCHRGQRIRLRWMPEVPGAETEFQVTLGAEGSGTSVVIHQEQLRDAEQRHQLTERWTRALNDLSRQR